MFVHLSFWCLGQVLGSESASSWRIFASLIFVKVLSSFWEILLLLAEFLPRGHKTFSCSTQLKFFLLINVKMLTIDGILTFMSGKNSILGLSDPKKSITYWHFYTYEHLKFHAQESRAWKKFYNLGPWLYICRFSDRLLTEKSTIEDTWWHRRSHTRRHGWRGWAVSFTMKCAAFTWWNTTNCKIK